MDSFCRTVVERNRVIAAIVMLLMLPAIYFATTIRLDSSTETFMVKRDPARAVYDAFREEFGSDEVMLVMVETPVMANRQKLDRLAERLATIPNVTDVYDPLDRYDPALPKNDAALREKVLKNKIAGNRYEAERSLLSLEEGYITFVLKVQPEQPEQRGRIFERVKEMVTAAGFDMDRVTIAGPPVLNHYLNETPRETGTVFFPPVCIVSFLLLYYLFREIRLILPPILLVASVELFIMGLVGVTGGTLNVITTIVPVILYIVTLAGAVHLLECLVAIRKEYESLEAALVETMRRKFQPCLFASLTTAVGFGSLTASPVEPVAALGFYLCLGSVLAFVLLYAFFPAILLLFLRRATVLPVYPMSGFFRGLVGFTERYRVAIIFLAALPLIYTVCKIPDIGFQTNGLYYFKEESYIRKNTAALEDRGVAPTSIELLLEGKENDFRNPYVLRRLDALGEKLESVDGLLNVYSVASLVREMNWIFANSPDMPGDRMTGIVLDGIEKKTPDLLHAYTNGDFSKARVSLGMKTVGYDEYVKVKRRVESVFAESGLAKDVRFTLTGQFPLILNVQTYLMQTLTKSLSWSFTAIAICFFVFTQSIGLGFLALVPNVFPVFCMLALVFAVGLDFDVANVMIGSVILGIAVDDTAHFIYQLKTAVASSSVKETILEVYEKTGRAILFTTVILSSGFFVFALSDFIPTRNFGILSSFAVAVALVGDLVVFPAILLAINPKTLWSN